MDAVKEQIRVGKAGDSLGVRNTVEIKYKEVQLIRRNRLDVLGIGGGSVHPN